VIAAEKACKCSWGILESVNDLLAIFDLPVLDPAAHLLCELRVEMPESVEDDETLHSDLLAQDFAHQPTHAVPADGPFRGVVLGHQTAHRYTRMRIQQRDDRVQNLAADIL